MAIGKTWVLVVCAVSGAWSALGQVAAPPPAARVEKVESARLGETREVWISVPDSYATSRDTYPVLYMLDAEFNFTSGTVGGLRHAAQAGEIPDFLVVGIRNTDRGKDAWPEEMTFRDGSKEGGRADRFLAFIAEELAPRVESELRTQPFRVLYGTSNMGFTAAYAMLRRPELANAVVAASATLRVPSFQSGLDATLKGFKGGSRRLVLVTGENDLPTVLTGNAELAERIAVLAPAGLSCRLKVVEGGGHVPPESLLEGVRALFQGWKLGRPLDEGSFAELRAQVDRRPERFGVVGNLPEDDLRGLAESLLAEGKTAKAVEVCRYRAESYPASADAEVALGDAYRKTGERERARECYVRARALDPSHAAAASRLAEPGP